MSKKQSYEVNLRIVEDYFKGTLSNIALANKYGISTRSLVERWGNNYKIYWKNSLKLKK
ncbi:hypothetical protein [Globicatella sp. HMSC072A10]|uniref:hypothetical protein n=1 Tax=Globicatella sp. HMSC072A10 TaxID=1739315 RepID=UPI00143955F6|nr:hypothetical protein [Globicatella sp. HMSC072A10]